MHDLDLSVILCSYNRADTLQRCLEYLGRQTLPREQWEVVLVNDGSSDHTDALVRGSALPFRLNYIAQSNTGLAGARNTGIAAARGRTLLLINDDTLAAPDMLEQHLAAQRAHPHRLILGAFDYEPWALESGFMQVVARTDVVFGYVDLQPGGTYDYMHSYTCNLSVPAAAYDEAGVFDTTFKSYGAEDTEAGYRLERAGYRVVYWPAARADHAHMLKVDEFVKRQLNVGANFATFFLRQPGAARQPMWGGLVTQSRSQLELAVERQAAAMRQAVEKVKALDQAWARAPTAQRPAIVAEMEPLVRQMAGYYWMAGLAEGMRREAIEHFGQLTERRVPPVRNTFSRQLESGLSLSVIIPTYNRLPVLQRCLAALEAQTLAPDRFEVLVCDDGSMDGTEAALRQYQASFRFAYLRGPNRGPAAARNMGLNAAHGKLAVIINDDTTLAPAALAQHLQIHQDWGGQPPIAVLGGFLPPEECRRTPVQMLVDDLFFPRDEMEPGRLHDGRILWTCNLSLPLEYLRAVGGFDESFRLAAAEDTDLGFRLAQRFGCRVLYRPDIHAAHQHAHTFDSFKRACLIRGRMTYRLAAKWPWLIPQWFGVAEFDGAGVATVRGQVTQLAPAMERAEQAVREIEQKFAAPAVQADRALVLSAAASLQPLLSQLSFYLHRLGMLQEMNDERHILEAQFADDIYYRGYPQRFTYQGRPAFSVVIPVAEDVDQLERTLRSVTGQDLPGWEVLLVDRSPRGAARGPAQRFAAANSSAHYFARPGTSEAGAVNAGFRHAQGLFVLVLRPGDTLGDDFLRTALPAVQRSTAALFYPHLLRPGASTPAAQKPFDFHALHRGQALPYCSLVRRTAWDRVGGCADHDQEGWAWDLCLRLAKAGLSLQPLERAAIYTRHLTRLSPEARAAIQRHHPDLYPASQPGQTPAPDATLANRTREEATLELLTAAGDLAEALDQYADRLDGELIDLLRRKAQAATEPELVRALTTLAAHVEQRVGAQPSPVSERAVETLQMLLAQPDLGRALHDHRDRLDDDLLALVRLNANTARADDKPELAQGLELLAEHIVRMIVEIPGSADMAEVPNSAATLQLLLDADDIVAALHNHVDRLDPELLALVRHNAQAAQADGDVELAEGLEALSEHIVGVIAARANAPLTS